MQKYKISLTEDELGAPREVVVGVLRSRKWRDEVFLVGLLMECEEVQKAHHVALRLQELFCIFRE